MAIDQLVEQISTYRRKPLFLHTFVVPFLAIQAIWFAYWWQNLGIEEHWELGCIVAVGIFILQALTALFCYWFVEVDALLNCIRISDPKNAQMAKVKPTPNNGWTEFVPLNRIRLPNGNIRISFCFQKIQYIYNDEQKEFHSVLFDTNLPFRIFQEAVAGVLVALPEN